MAVGAHDDQGRPRAKRLPRTEHRPSNNHCAPGGEPRQRCRSRRVREQPSAGARDEDPRRSRLQPSNTARLGQNSGRPPLAGHRASAGMSHSLCRRGTSRAPRRRQRRLAAAPALRDRRQGAASCRASVRPAAPRGGTSARARVVAWAATARTSSAPWSWCRESWSSTRPGRPLKTPSSPPVLRRAVRAGDPQPLDQVVPVGMHDRISLRAVRAQSSSRTETTRNVRMTSSCSFIETYSPETKACRSKRKPLSSWRGSPWMS